MGTNYYERRHIYSDSALVAAYLDCGSQIKAAARLGVSRETVARAVRRAGIKLSGTKSNGKNQPNRKASDVDLIENISCIGLIQTACKFGLSVEQCYRRAKKLGLDVEGQSQKSSWKNRLLFYGGVATGFDDSITLDAVIERYGGICQLCGKPVDRSDKANGHIKRLYPTVDHIIPLSKGGAHTWANVQLAHMVCNSRKGAQSDCGE